jgi:hypothetical protein
METMHVLRFPALIGLLGIGALFGVLSLGGHFWYALIASCALAAAWLLWVDVASAG